MNTTVQQTSTLDTQPQRMMLTIPEVAILLRISRSAACELAQRKGFPVLRMGRTLRVPRRQALEIWVSEHLGRLEDTED